MILHLTRKEKFTKHFIKFIESNFNKNEHFFLLVGGQKHKEFFVQEKENIKIVNTKLEFVKFFKIFHKLMYKSDKIIIHGLSQPYCYYYLFLNPCLLKKSYWVMWGADFYFPEKQPWIKKQVIKRMGNFITYIRGDYELVKKWYKAKGNYYKCFMYPSNLYKKLPLKKEKNNKSTINVQVGNSAAPENNHFEILERLSKYKDENIKIYAPLSYGDMAYAEKVIKEGKKIFEEKFIPLTNFMQFDKYLEFLSNIDIAIFAHNRQQAMGNIITLLGLGKKVYMRSDITPWLMFNELGIKIFDVENIELSSLDERTKKENIEKIKTYFSEENLKKQLEEIFKL